MTCCVNLEKWVFKGWKIATSNGWIMCIVYGGKQYICTELFLQSSTDFFFYNNVYTKLKTNVKKAYKHTAVPRRQNTVCLKEKLKSKNL